MEQHFKPYAGEIAQQLGILAEVEQAIRFRPKDEAEILPAVYDKVYQACEMLLIYAHDLGVRQSEANAAILSNCARNNVPAGTLL